MPPVTPMRNGGVGGLVKTNCPAWQDITGEGCQITEETGRLSMNPYPVGSLSS
jgi:hypothetical protein